MEQSGMWERAPQPIPYLGRAFATVVLPWSVSLGVMIALVIRDEPRDVAPCLEAVCGPGLLVGALLTSFLLVSPALIGAGAIAWLGARGTAETPSAWHVAEILVAAILAASAAAGEAAYFNETREHVMPGVAAGLAMTVLVTLGAGRVRAWR